MISEICREGRATFESVVLFSREADRARFLFGKDVTSYLQETRNNILNLRIAEAMAKSDDDARRAKGADLEAEHLMKITEFYEKFSSLIRPYVKMHQKAPPF